MNEQIEAAVQGGAEVAAEAAVEGAAESVAVKPIRRARPKRWRKIILIDNKYNPDRYIAGIVAAFLGLEWLEPWYPVLFREDGARAYQKGKLDAANSVASMLTGCEAPAGTPTFHDYIGDLWRVRNTDPQMFDEAICKRFGCYRGMLLTGEIIKQGAVAAAECEAAEDAKINGIFGREIATKEIDRDIWKRNSNKGD